MINILFLVYILNKILINNYKINLEEDIEIDLKKIEQLKWL
jgi:hypothetical protein